MTQLVWTQDPIRYETGVDRGVLYPDGGIGVAWNSLLSVEETFEGGAVKPYHYDGIKYINLASAKNYQAVLTGLSAPNEFGECLGDKAVVPGLILTRQAKKPFGFSYRTILDADAGYKIHLVYNATASINQVGNSTINQSLVPNTYSWSVVATPPVSTNLYRPSSHYIIDSTKIDSEILGVIETILYGSLDTNPYLPTQDELVDLVVNWSPFLVNENTVTGLAPMTAGTGDLYETRIDGIYQTLPHSRLIPSLINGLSRMG